MSNASGSVGFGIYFGGHWCTEEWLQDWCGSEISRDLTFLEFFPVLVSVQLWGGSLANRMVHFWIDNLAVLQVVNTLTSRSPCVMNLVCAFTLLCLHLNILFMTCHVPGVSNGVSDALSCQQMVRFGC